MNTPIDRRSLAEADRIAFCGFEVKPGDRVRISADGMCRDYEATKGKRGKVVLIANGPAHEKEIK
jgi:hypothetical protein